MHAAPESQFAYLTTTGRITGLPREIEIWYVADPVSAGRLFLLAEHFHKTKWVKNIQAEPKVKLRLNGIEHPAVARILDRDLDGADWDLAQRLGREKYGWGEGLPVEILLTAL